jgi:hypothetical protein
MRGHWHGWQESILSCWGRYGIEELLPWNVATKVAEAPSCAA